MRNASKKIRIWSRVARPLSKQLLVQVFILPLLLGLSFERAWALDWINPSVTVSAVSDGVCLTGPFDNATSANVSVDWTAFNTDAGPGRSLLLVKWNEGGGSMASTGALFANAPVGQLPTQTTIVSVTDTDLDGSTAYFALRDNWDTGAVWSDTRSPALSADLTGPASGSSGYVSIDMSADPDCVGSPEINVTGNGANISDGDAIVSSFDHTNFGSIAHLSGTISRTFTIQNTGNATLSLGANAATLSGTNAADFTVTSQPDTTVAAAGSTSLTVQFDPSALGSRTATLSIANDDSDENPYTFAILGTGAGLPEINVTGNGQNIVDGDTTPQAGDHTDFGSIDINDGHIERTFTIENTGDATLSLGPNSVSLSGPDAAEFSISTQPSSSVFSGSSRTFSVRFDPSAAGAKSATLSIVNDDADESPYRFAISGTGTAAPEIEVRRDGGGLIGNGTDHVANRVASLSFNEASGTHTYTINNLGSDTLTISNVTITGSHAAEFSIVTPPAGTVAAGGSTSVTLRFTQTTSGVRTANLNFTNNDADEGAFSFGISGFRFAGPDLDLQGNALDIGNGDATPRPEDDTDFGSVDVISGFVEKSFTGTNNGDSPIVVSSITVTGTHASDFSVTTGIGFVPLTVRFDPSASGLRTATVNIASDALVDNPFTFAVQGTGTAAAPEIDVSSSEGGAVADGGTDAQGNEAAAVTKTVTYTVDNSAGTDTLSVSNIAISNLSNVTSATPSTTTLNIAAGATDAFSVDYVPTLAGAFSFDLDITSNDADEGNYDTTVSGTGVGNAEINVLAGITVPIADNPAHDPASLGGTRLDTTVGGASTSLFTIENTGTDVLTLGANAVSLSGTGIGDFSVSQQPATTVAPGTTTSFRIRFAPTSAGLQGPVDVAINSDDADENPYNFRVQGLGREIEMDVTGNGQAIADNPAHTPDASDHTDFGSADIAVGSVTRTFTIENNGVGFFLQPDPNAVSLSGTHAADFTVAVQPATSVDVGLSTTFQIAFDPSAAGVRGPVDVSIASNDPDESPYNFRIQGTGSVAPEINVTGNSQSIVDGDTTAAANDHTDFGSTDIASGLVSRTFTLQNSGSGALTLGAAAATLSGADAADFSVTSQPATTVAASTSTIVVVQFDPSALGTKDAVLSITNDDADEGPYNFALAGTGTGAPEINVTGNAQSIVDGDTSASVTDHTDFGLVDFTVGTVSRTFTIENIGTDTLTLGAMAASLSGINTADYAITSQPATTVAPAGSTTVVVQFDPSVLGARVATLTIANDDGDEAPYDFALSGTGTGAPEINVLGNGQSIVDGDSTPVTGDYTDFGAADVASAPISRSFTIQNLGTDVLTLGANAVTLSGTNAGDFLIISQPAGTVSASGSAIVTVQFSPTALGARTAMLTIANDDSDEAPYSFALTGVGSSQPEINLLGNTVAIVDGDTTPDIADHTDFGSADITGVQIGRTFTIQNLGGSALTLGANSASLSGPHAADYLVTNQPASTVAASGATTVTVQFDPSALGARVATLTITSDDADEGTYDIALSGAGTGVPEMNLVGNTVAISDGTTAISSTDGTDFGLAGISGAAVVSTFTIQNVGTDILTLPSGVVIAGAHVGDFTVTSQPPGSIAPGGSGNFSISFSPALTGARTASVSIANNDADENPYNFDVQGTGVVGGSVTIVQNVSGADMTFGFSSPTSALNLSLTTVNGTAQSTISGVASGVHSLTVDDMTGWGFGVAAISCDDPNSFGNKANRTATINLAAGGAVTCTFEAIDTRGPTSQMVADFLGARNTLLLSHQPDRGRRVDRLKGGSGVSAGDQLTAFGHNLRAPLPVDVEIDENEFSIASSFSRLMGLSNETSQSDLSDGHRFDVWGEARVARTLDGTSGGATFTLISVGADYLVEPDILIGFMGQYDRFKQDLSGVGRRIDGNGWMAGPYATLKLNDNLYFDIRGAWGRSTNDINPFGTYTDTFETSRWLISSALVGQFNVNNWDIQPSYALQFLRERQRAYVDGLGVTIPEQVLSQGDMRFGPKFSYRHQFEDGNTLSPSVAFEGVYTFGERDTFSKGSFASETQGFTGQVHAGLGYQSQGGHSVSLSADYGGIGGSAKSFGLSFTFSVPLN